MTGFKLYWRDCLFSYDSYFLLIYLSNFGVRTKLLRGWSGGAMVLGKLWCRGVLLIWVRVGQGKNSNLGLSEPKNAECLDIFILISI